MAQLKSTTITGNLTVSGTTTSTTDVVGGGVSLKNLNSTVTNLSNRVTTLTNNTNSSISTIQQNIDAINGRYPNNVIMRCGSSVFTGVTTFYNLVSLTWDQVRSMTGISDIGKANCTIIVNNGDNEALGSVFYGGTQQNSGFVFLSTEPMNNSTIRINWTAFKY